MKKLLLLLGVLSSAPNVSANANTDWFEQNTPLTQAHQHLLMGQLPAMFESLVEVWQSKESNNLHAHLNALLLQSLQIDCGKSFTKDPFPDWIKSITVRRIEIQSPERDTYQFIIDVSSSSDIQDVYIHQWVDKTPSMENSLSKIESDGVTTYVRRYNLTHKPEQGLYRITVIRTDGSTWSQWLLLEESKNNHSVHWTSTDEWKVEKTALPNAFCPLPKLDVSLYSFENGKYAEIWHNAYESKYPNSLPRNIVDPNRYILAVSMNYLRWQGPILIEQSQVISKTYDVTNDD